MELDMINVLSAADNTFIVSSSQAIVNWLNALDQSDFSEWVWCIIIRVITLQWDTSKTNGIILYEAQEICK